MVPALPLGLCWQGLALGRENQGVQQVGGLLRGDGTPTPVANTCHLFTRSYGRVYAAADPYHHTIGPAATYSIGTMVRAAPRPFFASWYQLQPAQGGGPGTAAPGARGVPGGRGASGSPMRGGCGRAAGAVAAQPLPGSVCGQAREEPPVFPPHTPRHTRSALPALATAGGRSCPRAAHLGSTPGPCPGTGTPCPLPGAGPCPQPSRGHAQGAHVCSPHSAALS